MFIYQPKDTFADILAKEFFSNSWTEASIASAWVRRTGILPLRESVIDFLRKKGKVAIVAGVDFNNTTAEGLKEIIALAEFGDVSAHIYCNEAGGVFHPKVFVFSNNTAYRMYVGSNNLTGAGLYSNNEAIVRLEGPCDDTSFQSARNAFVSWTDESNGVSKKLDDELLTKLLEKGYIQTEEHARQARATTFGKRLKGAEPLFGSITVPSIPKAFKSSPPKVESVFLPRPAAVPSLSSPNNGNQSKDFWIEAGALTGGSRNQLDLSMISHYGRIPGSISFFSINPVHVAVESQITVRFKGVDYQGNIIKYPQTGAGKTNGTWRLQLNGVSPAGSKLTKQCASFRGKILQFRVIGNAHYEIIAVDPKSALDALITKSKVWDTNRGTGGRHFGHL